MKVTVETVVAAPMEVVWSAWTEPEHITKWCAASVDWHAPRAENDLQIGGRFTTRMEARDGSAGFDFGGVYTALEEHSKIEYMMDDGRTVQIHFETTGEGIEIIETFDTENKNSAEMQRAGWQSILNRFKEYAEGLPK